MLYFIYLLSYSHCRTSPLAVATLRKARGRPAVGLGWCPEKSGRRGVGDRRRRRTGRMHHPSIRPTGTTTDPAKGASSSYGSQSRGFHTALSRDRNKSELHVKALNGIRGFTEAALSVIPLIPFSA